MYEKLFLSLTWTRIDRYIGTLILIKIRFYPEKMKSQVTLQGYQRQFRPMTSVW